MFSIGIVWICRFGMVVIVNSGGLCFFVKIGVSVLVFVVVL